MKYREELFSASVNKIFSDLCLGYVFACKAFSTFKHTPVTNRYKTFKQKRFLKMVSSSLPRVGLGIGKGGGVENSVMSIKLTAISTYDCKLADSM